MNVNSTSSKASSNGGLSGLASGVDTDAMVEALLSNTQAKIDKQNQSLTQTQWKQEMYRSVIDSINTFKGKYFDNLSSTNFMNGSAFQAISAKVSSSAFSVVADQSAAFGSKKIDVAQLASATTITSNTSVGSDIQGKFDLSQIAEGESATVDVLFNGVKKTISLTNDGTDLSTQLQQGLDKAFGENNIKIDHNTADDTFTLSSANVTDEIEITGSKEGLAAIGVSANTSNSINVSNSLKDSSFTNGITSDTYKFTINGTTFEGDTSESIKSVMDKINKSDAGVKISYDALNDKFSMQATQTGKGQDVNISDEEGNVLSAMFGTTDLSAVSKEEGKNAVIAIDGTVLERSTNTFDVSGMTIRLKDVTDSKLNVSYDSVTGAVSIDNLSSATGTGTVEVSQNVDDVVNSVKSFVSDYNKLIGDLNSMLSESKDYKKYPPLTDAQKSEMSDKEIELWEEKSKKGLLAGDSNIQDFLSNMRSIMGTKNEAGVSMYDLGLDTGNWESKGQIVIDENKLRAAIEKDSNAVNSFFSGKTGVAEKLSAEIDRVAKKSSGSPGVLVSIAGAVGTGKENSNRLTDQMKQINEKIAQLKDSYEREKARYWKQFSAMETALSNISGQNSWMSSMGGATM